MIIFRAAVINYSAPETFVLMIFAFLLNLIKKIFAEFKNTDRNW